LSKNMADQEKSFRARRLAFGGRVVLCLLAAALVAGPARAQDAGLKNGAASVAAGKYSDAVRQLSATINSENASPGEAAKALYLRGIAYRKLGEPARAVADLGAAVWLGLPEPDRVKALVNRGLAYRSAGLSKEAEAELASARKVGGSTEVDKLIAEGGGATESAASLAAFSTEVRPGDQASASNEGSSWFSLSRFRNRSGTPAPAATPQPEPAPTRTASASPQWTTTTSKPGETEAPGAWSTSVANADPPSNTTTATRSGNRFTRWFGSVSDSAPAPAPAPPPQPAPTTQTAAATPQPSKPPAAAAASSSWSTTTENASADAGGEEKKSSWRLFGRSAEAEPAAPPAAPSSGSGGYQLQLANSRSEGEANALWKKISQSQGLSGVSHEIEKIEIGNFGTFYSLKIGPFPDKAQSVKVCNALKRNGIDCLPATL
jgi:tetratricopeptide (TPR) repeat protein